MISGQCFEPRNRINYVKENGQITGGRALHLIAILAWISASFNQYMVPVYTWLVATSEKNIYI